MNMLVISRCVCVFVFVCVCVCVYTCIVFVFYVWICLLHPDVSVCVCVCVCYTRIVFVFYVWICLLFPDVCVCVCVYMRCMCVLCMNMLVTSRCVCVCVCYTRIVFVFYVWICLFNPDVSVCVCLYTPVIYLCVHTRLQPIGPTAYLGLMKAKTSYLKRDKGTIKLNIKHALNANQYNYVGTSWACCIKLTINGKLDTCTSIESLMLIGYGALLPW